MPIQVVCSPFRRTGFDFGHPRKIVFVVDAVAKEVAEISQSPLQSISCSLLLCFLESSRPALAILDMAISDVLAHLVSLLCLTVPETGAYLVIRAVFERDSQDYRQSQADLATRSLVYLVILRRCLDMSDSDLTKST